MINSLWSSVLAWYGALKCHNGTQPVALTRYDTIGMIIYRIIPPLHLKTNILEIKFSLWNARALNTFAQERSLPPKCSRFYMCTLWMWIHFWSIYTYAINYLEVINKKQFWQTLCQIVQKLSSFCHFNLIKIYLTFQRPLGHLVLKTIAGPYFLIHIWISNIFYTSSIKIKPTFSRAIWAFGLIILWALTRLWGQLARGPTYFDLYLNKIVIIYQTQSLLFHEIWVTSFQQHNHLNKLQAGKYLNFIPLRE